MSRAVVCALNGELDYAKTHNYWKYLKAKLKRENLELVSGTTQLKLAAELTVPDYRD